MEEEHSCVSVRDGALQEYKSRWTWTLRKSTTRCSRIIGLAFQQTWPWRSGCLFDVSHSKEDVLNHKHRAGNVRTRITNSIRRW